MNIQNQIKLGQELLARGETERAVKMFAAAAEKDPKAFLELSAFFEADDPRKARRYRELARSNAKRERECARRAARTFHRSRGVLGSNGGVRISRAQYQVLDFMKLSEMKAMHEAFRPVCEQNRRELRRLQATRVRAAQAEREREALLMQAAYRILAMCGSPAKKSKSLAKLLQSL